MKSISTPLPRLQRLLLRMAKYDGDMRYIPLRTNIAADRLCGRREHMMTLAQFCLIIFEGLVPV